MDPNRHSPGLQHGRLVLLQLGRQPAPACKVRISELWRAAILLHSLRLACFWALVLIARFALWAATGPPSTSALRTRAAIWRTVRGAQHQGILVLLRAHLQAEVVYEGCGAIWGLQAQVLQLQKGPACATLCQTLAAGPLQTSIKYHFGGKARTPASMASWQACTNLEQPPAVRACSTLIGDTQEHQQLQQSGHFPLTCQQLHCRCPAEQCL